MPELLATQETEIGGSLFKASLRQIVPDTRSLKKSTTKKGLEEGLKW
jgi:hypothetical protein